MIEITRSLRTKVAVSAMMMACCLHVPQASAIKKCQDENGKWHYGDVAVEECERSKVTTLNRRGFIRKEQAAPKTKEEIAAEREASEEIERQKKQEAKKTEERNRILSVYQSEADIDRQRDNQVYSVSSNIAVHEIYIKSMRAKVTRLEEQKAKTKPRYHEPIQKQIDDSLAKIDESEKELEALEVQKKQIEERFAREKELYLSLKEEAAAS